MKAKLILFGAIGYPILIVVLFHIFGYSLVDELQTGYFQLERLDVAVVRNIRGYSSTPILFLLLYYIHLLSTPLMIVYWYQVIKVTNMNNYVIPLKAYFLHMFPLIFLLLAFEFVEIESVSRRRVRLFLGIYDNLFLFYCFVLLPINCSAFIVAKFISDLSLQFVEKLKE